jgi:mannose/fructose/N-acetylgalactosamine-specific phosphotransferase system component IIC
LTYLILIQIIQCENSTFQEDKNITSKSVSLRKVFQSDIAVVFTSKIRIVCVVCTSNNHKALKLTSRFDIKEVPLFNILPMLLTLLMYFIIDKFLIQISHAIVNDVQFITRISKE